MRYEIKGNYYNGQFHLAPLSGTKAGAYRTEKTRLIDNCLVTLE